MTAFQKLIRQHGACAEGIRWAGDRTWPQIYKALVKGRTRSSRLNGYIVWLHDADLISSSDCFCTFCTSSPNPQAPKLQR